MPGNERRMKRKYDGGSETAYKGSEDDEMVEAENAETVSKNDEERLRNSIFPQSVEELHAGLLLDGSQIGAENDIDPDGLKKADNFQALGKNDIGLSEAWNLSCEAYIKHFLENWSHWTSHSAALVWPPMLLVCIHGIEAKDEALDGMRKLLVSKGLHADVTEFVCSEGNTFYDLFVLPPTGLAFAAAKAVDGIIRTKYTCYYPRLKDMEEIRYGRLPEFSRTFIPNLRYHGMERQAWNGLKVDLLRDDGMCAARGVCQKSEATDCVDGEVLGDMHVGVQVLEIVEDLIPFDWEGSVRCWKTTSVLHKSVSLFECLRQHTCSRVAGSYCEDSQDDLDIQHAQGVLKDLSLMSVAPWVSSCKVDEGTHSLSAEYSKICEEAFHDIKKNLLKTSARNDFEEGYWGGLPFEKKLENDEDLRMRQIRICLTNTRTAQTLMKHLATSNGYCLARGAVERLKVLHNLNESRADSTLISIMIKAAEDMELSTLCSIKEQVQLERQGESILENLEKIGKEAILQLREQQHKSLMQLLAKNEANQISKLEEFVDDKFNFVSRTLKAKKETEGVVDWLSQHIGRATDEIKRAHLIEKRKWEEQLAKLEEQGAKSKAELQAVKQEAEEQATKVKIELEAAKRKAEEKTSKSENELRAARLQAKRQAQTARRARQEALQKATSLGTELQVARWEAEHQAAKLKIELQAAQREINERKSAMPTCAICFEDLEGTVGKKHNQDGVVLRKRACFVPCMHANMCSTCSDEAWEKYKRCPVCNTECSKKPEPIFV